MGYEYREGDSVFELGWNRRRRILFHRPLPDSGTESLGMGALQARHQRRLDGRSRSGTHAEKPLQARRRKVLQGQDQDVDSVRRPMLFQQHTGTVVAQDRRSFAHRRLLLCTITSATSKLPSSIPKGKWRSMSSISPRTGRNGADTETCGSRIASGVAKRALAQRPQHRAWPRHKPRCRLPPRCRLLSADGRFADADNLGNLVRQPMDVVCSRCLQEYNVISAPEWCCRCESGPATRLIIAPRLSCHTLDISPIGDGWADYTIRYRPVRPSRYSGGKTDLSSG